MHESLDKSEKERTYLFVPFVYLTLASCICVSVSAAKPAIARGQIVSQQQVSRSPSVILVADPPSIKIGGCTTLIWDAANAQTVQISGIGTVALSGSRRVCPDTSAEYHIIAISASGTANATAKVTLQTADSKREPQKKLPSEANVVPDMQFKEIQNLSKISSSPSPAEEPPIPIVAEPAQPTSQTTAVESEPPGVLETFLQALVAEHDGAALASALQPMLGSETNPQRLRAYAGLALQVSQTATAQKAYEKLLGIQPQDREALRWLGIFAFEQGRYATAEHHLSRLLANTAGDYRSNFYFGEIFLRNKEKSRARFYWQRALQQVEESSPQPFSMRLVRAFLLHRLERPEDSFKQFEALLKQAPQDKNLRADYITVLIERGKYNDAQRILSMP
jgi:Tfp pilus assembly protein PilF